MLGDLLNFMNIGAVCAEQNVITIRDGLNMQLQSAIQHHFGSQDRVRSIIQPDFPDAGGPLAASFEEGLPADRTALFIPLDPDSACVSRGLVLESLADAFCS